MILFHEQDGPFDDLWESAAGWRAAGLLDQAGGSLLLEGASPAVQSVLGHANEWSEFRSRQSAP
jgi:hypothetical protein